MRYRYLLHPAFIVGLLLLLLNDHYWKGLYGNWLTGKLSDFAGLLIFPFFLRFLFPISDKQAVWATLLGFVFWKTPYAQGGIDFFNSLGGWQLSRVVDYTDFIAFVVLPLSYYFLKNWQRADWLFPLSKPLAYALLLPLALFAFIATSDDSDLYFLDDSITNCCINDGQMARVGLGQLYIPSAFTPDGNGINDYFQVFPDSFVLAIDTFIVEDFSGFSQVFLATDMTDFSEENGFDGVVNDTIVARRYRYAIKVNALGAEPSWVRGEFCAIPCVVPAEQREPINFMRCGYGTQFRMPGGYDPEAEIGEPLDCFE